MTARRRQGRTGLPFWRLGQDARTELARRREPPRDRTVWNLGGGTAAQRRVSSESGARSTAKVPSEKRFFRAMRTRPSGPRVTRSCAMGGLSTYLRRA